MAVACGDDAGDTDEPEESSAGSHNDAGPVGSDEGGGGGASSEAGSAGRSAGSGGTTGGSDAGDCDEVVDRFEGFAEELGCTVDPKDKEICEALYAMDVCVKEWEAMNSCLPRDSGDYECDADSDAVQPKSAAVCASERDAFADCIAAQ